MEDYKEKTTGIGDSQMLENIAEDWKKEFDEKYPHQASMMFERNNIIKFIENTLDKQKKEIIKALDKEFDVYTRFGVSDVSMKDLIDKLK